VSQVEDVKKLVDLVIKRFGQIDILVNNAGTGYYKPFLETSEKEWDTTLDTNLKGVFLLCKKTVPHMTEGLIVNVSSGAGKSGFPNFTAYCASKFGLIGFSESLSKELNNVKICTLCPGPVDTKLYRDNFGHSPPTQPEEIANIIIDLCMNDDYPSGRVLDL